AAGEAFVDTADAHGRSYRPTGCKSVAGIVGVTAAEATSWDMRQPAATDRKGNRGDRRAIGLGFRSSADRLGRLGRPRAPESPGAEVHGPCGYRPHTGHAVACWFARSEEARRHGDRTVSGPGDSHETGERGHRGRVHLLCR